MINNYGQELVFNKCVVKLVYNIFFMYDMRIFVFIRTYNGLCYCPLKSEF